jgi:hypothetical protein
MFKADSNRDGQDRQDKKELKIRDYRFEIK